MSSATWNDVSRHRHLCLLAPRYAFTTRSPTLKSCRPRPSHSPSGFEMHAVRRWPFHSQRPLAAKPIPAQMWQVPAQPGKAQKLECLACMKDRAQGVAVPTSRSGPGRADGVPLRVRQNGGEWAVGGGSVKKRVSCWYVVSAIRDIRRDALQCCFAPPTSRSCSIGARTCHPVHICPATWPTPSTSAPRLGLHAHRCTDRQAN